MDMGKKGLYMIQSLVFAYIATGILLCLLAFYHLSKQCRNEDRESWNHTYIYSCICFCWHADRK